MRERHIQWGRAVLGAVLGEVLQVAATFGWVAIYSYLINPGHPAETYQRYAQAAGPYVSIVAGAPVFYLVSRWVARSVPTAVALFAVFLVLDGVLLIVGVDRWTAALLVQAAASYLTKLAACYLGGRHAESQPVARAPV